MSPLAPSPGRGERGEKAGEGSARLEGVCNGHRKGWKVR